MVALRNVTKAREDRPHVRDGDVMHFRFNV
jgi:hypothetical protein